MYKMKGYDIHCSTTPPSETQLRSLFSSEKCCQGVVYVGMTRRNCAIFLTCLFLLLLYLVTSLTVPNPEPPPPPRPAADNRARSQGRRRDSASLALESISTSDLLPRLPQKLVRTLKNPCWMEEEWDRLDRYEGNPYVIVSSRARKSFERLLRRRVQRQSRGYDDGDAAPSSFTRKKRRLRCVPYFYIAGMPKCGTTDLYSRLTRHPDILGGVMKEPHWWTRKRFGPLHPQNFNGTKPLKPASFDHYVDLFDEAAEEILEDDDRDLGGSSKPSTKVRSAKIVVDASASLLWDNDGWLNYLNWSLSADAGRNGSKLPAGILPPLIASHLRHLHPSAKLIVMLRDPVKRLYSDYLYFRINGKKTVDDFHDRVKKSIVAFRECTRVHSLAACVYAPEVNNAARIGGGDSLPSIWRPVGTSVRLRIGIYEVFLRDWLNRFPREQILVLRLEDYATDTSETLKRIAQLLGVSAEDGEWEKRGNGKGIANRKYVDIGPMKNETETMLREFYAVYNVALARLLGDDKFLWEDSTGG